MCVCVCVAKKVECFAIVIEVLHLVDWPLLYREEGDEIVYLYLKDNIVHINSCHPFALHPYHTIPLPIIIEIDEHVVGQTISTCRLE